MLEEQGYSVLEAENGMEGLHRVAARDARLDLVLTDVVMPGLSEPDMVLRLMDSHPETKFLYMSGYTGELAIEHGLSQGVPLVEKPFTRAALLKAIQFTLRGTQ